MGSWRRAAVDPVLLPALLTIAAGLLLAIDDGGFDGTARYAVALFELALLALVCAVAPPPGGLRALPAAGALTALVAFALFALLSGMWSDVPSLAWDGANLVVLYAIVLAIVTLRPWPARAFAIALGLVGGGLAVIALGVLIDSATGGDPSGLFLESRLSEPAGYVNAAASLWLIGVWPALALACSARCALGVRAAALGVACLLLEVSLLSVSRGALAATAITALAFVVLSGERHKALAGLALVLVCCALAAGPLLAVSDAASPAELDGALGSARAAIAWTCLLATALAAAGMFASRRAAGRTSEQTRSAWARRAVRGAAIASALVVVVALASTGNPAAWADERWQDFKSSGYSRVGTGPERLTASLGSSRYDFYRVALNEFRGHPLAGIGYGNFAVPYLVARRTDEAPRYAHSLPFGVLAQLGVLGAALLLAFLGAASLALRRALAAVSGDRRTLVAGALAGFVVWFAHGFVDWLWEFPALGMLAFALLGLAIRGIEEPRPGAAEDRPAAAENRPAAAKDRPGAAEDRPAAAEERPGAAKDRPQAPQDGRRATRRGPAVALARQPRLRRAPQIASVAAAALVAASFATLGISARLAGSAREDAARDPAAAAQRLERAARLDPLAAGPLLTRGVLLQRLGDTRAAERSFQDALGREPRNWFAQLELGVLRAGDGRRAAALRALDRAAALNPRQQAITTTRKAVSAGETVTATDLERSLYEDAARRLRPVRGP